MIYGFSAEGDTYAAVDRCVAAGVHFLRSYDQSTSTAATEIRDMVLYAARKKVKLLLQYNGNAPMPVGNLVSHIGYVGPAGSIWTGGDAQYQPWAPTHIEVFNEKAYVDNQAAAAVPVAQTVQAFYNAVGPTLGANAMQFIVEGDDAAKGTMTWLNTLIATVPTIRSMLDGWVVHNYGPRVVEQDTSYYNLLGTMVNNLASKGYTTDKIWITENGISSDDGAMLDNNYGWARNKRYDQAGADMLALVRHFGTGLPYSNRIHCFLQYQPFDQLNPGASGGREFYFGIYKLDKSPKGALTSTAIQLATEFPLGGTTIQPPPDPVNPPPSGFIINGQRLEWAAVAGAVNYKVFDPFATPSNYVTLSSATLSYTPTPRPGETVSYGWTYVLADGFDHWVTEQTITYPGTITALQMSTTVGVLNSMALTESVTPSAEITDVVYRSVGVTRTYSVAVPFQVSTGRELTWNTSAAKFFYKEG